MEPGTVLAVILLTLGVTIVLRAVAIIASGGMGRFRSDPAVSVVAGFALILLGQWLLQ